MPWCFGGQHPGKLSLKLYPICRTTRPNTLPKRIQSQSWGSIGRIIGLFNRGGSREGTNHAYNIGGWAGAFRRGKSLPRSDACAVCRPRLPPSSRRGPCGAGAACAPRLPSIPPFVCGLLFCHAGHRLTATAALAHRGKRNAAPCRAGLRSLCSLRASGGSPSAWIEGRRGVGREQRRNGQTCRPADEPIARSSRPRTPRRPPAAAAWSPLAPRRLARPAPARPAPRAARFVIADASLCCQERRSGAAKRLASASNDTWRRLSSILKWSDLHFA